MSRIVEGQPDTSRAQLKSMLAAMIEGIIAVDSSDHVLYCNKAAYRLLACPLRDCRNMLLSEVPGFKVLTPSVEEARRRRQLAEGEFTIHSGNEERILQCNASPFADDTGSGVMLVVHDVTRIRQLERMRRDFVANVSHEIKTPLTSIKGYVETLLSGALYDNSINSRFLMKVHSNTNRLIALVQDILSLANIESHENELQLDCISWHTIIDLILGPYDDLIKRKQLKVEKRYHTPLYVLGEKEAMTQIFDNLLSNAIRYSLPQGTIRISLYERGESREGILEVQDAGLGIPKDEQERIFERFYRVDKDRSRELGGTGLGLSIVKHLVSSLKGKIEVQSDPGVGSAFLVSLPLQEAEASDRCQT